MRKDKVSLRQQIEEIELELRQRESNSRPKQSASKKRFHTERLQAVLTTLQWMLKHEQRFRDYMVEKIKEEQSA